VEISAVRRHVQAAMGSARDRARQRRQRAEEADKAYESFLERLAIPLARQVVSVLKAEGYAFTVSTPGRGSRVSSEHGRDDYVDVELRADGDAPRVVGHIRRTRGSRTIDEEQLVAPEASPEAITEEQFLTFLLRALEPWLER